MLELIQTNLPLNLEPSQWSFFEPNRSYSPAQFEITYCKSVYIANSGIAFTCFGLLKNSVYRYKDRQNKYKAAALYNFLVKRRVKIAQKELVSFIHNYYCPGYYHWITEALPRLFALREHVDFGKITFVVPDHYPQYVWETLSYLNVNSILRLKRNQIAFARTVLLTSNPHEGSVNNLRLTASIRTFFTALVKPRDRASKIYISRKSSPRRRIVNEDQVCDILIRQGFIILETEKLSFLDQLSYFSYALTLISIHGAGLSNMNFMKPGGAVLELYRQLDSDDYFNMSYWRLAHACGLDYYTLWCQPEVAGSPFDSANIIVDMDKFEKLLLSIIKSKNERSEGNKV
jgi:hypothetical protein